MNLVKGVLRYTVPSFVWRPAPTKPDQQQLTALDNGAQLVRSAEVRLARTDQGVKEEEKMALALLQHTAGELTPRAQMDMLARLDATPTLLPERLASLITAASLAARVSLRSSAFLIELIFEASRYGTTAGLGITRRALIAAVGSASAAHKTVSGRSTPTGDEGREQDDTFLNLLDRYTAVGCYLIHSAFTLTELFAIAGLQLTQSAFSTGFGAAEESVRMFDSIFGSNESSRALSAIIMLVRRELLQDPRFTPSQAGTLGSLVALTKALTAFACLQVATRRRTVAGMKMRVVWDATVVAEAEVDPSQGPFRLPSTGDAHGQGIVETLERARLEQRAEAEEASTSPQHSPTGPRTRPMSATSTMRTPEGTRRDRRRSIMMLQESDKEGLITDVRSQMESGRTWHDDRDRAGAAGGRASGTVSAAGSIRSQHRSRTYARVDSFGTLTGVGERLAMSSATAEQEDQTQEGAEITWELERLLSGGEEEEQGEGEVTEEVRGAEDLPEDIKRALLRAARGEAEEGYAMEVLGSDSRRARAGSADDDEVRLVRLSNSGAAVFQVTTTTTTTTTTTMVQTTAPIERRSSRRDDEASSTEHSLASMHAGSHRQRASSVRGKVEQVFGTPLSRSKSVTEAAQLFREDEWVEVQSRLSHSRSHHAGDPLLSPHTGFELEYVPPPSVGALARTTTLESPEEGKQKLQVVLKTMTKKLTQRSHTVRRLTTANGRSGSPPRFHIGSGTTSAAESDGEETDEEDGERSSNEKRKGKVMLGMRKLGGRAKKALRTRPSAIWDRTNGSPPDGKRVGGKDQVMTARRGSERRPLADVDWSAGQPKVVAGPATPTSKRSSRRLPANTVPFPGGVSTEPGSSSDESDHTPVQSSRAPSSRHTAPQNAHAGDVFSASGPTRSRRASATSARSVRTTKTTRTQRTHVETNAVSAGAGGPPVAVFPTGSLVSNLARYMRYASAAYGQQFLRIMGIGVDAFNFPTTKAHHSNHHAFASHVGIPVDHILYSSYAEPRGFVNDELDPLVHYIAVDSASSAIVLTIRGTLGLSDILLDLTCQYEPIDVDGGEADHSYLAHSGMLHSALRLRRESSVVHETLKQALIDHPTYGLIVTGHSLGGGVAALLAVLFSTKVETFKKEAKDEGISGRHPTLTTPFVTSFKSGLPPGRPIHCYAFGCPAVASYDLGRYCRGLVTSVCHGIDLVPTLSLGVLGDLKNVAVSLYEEETVASEIIGRVIGLYQSRRRKKSVPTAAKVPMEEKAAPSGLLAGIGAPLEVVEVEMDDDELAAGRGANRAGRQGYTDPALMVADLGREKEDDAPELADWLWSLMRTMRASSDAEKLYPSGDVWHVENFEVFVHDTSPNGKERSRPGQKRTRREGRRIILRACDDVPARFSEPIFGRTMFHDHIPTNYELALQLLEEAVSPPS